MGWGVSRRAIVLTRMLMVAWGMGSERFEKTTSGSLEDQDSGVASVIKNAKQRKEKRGV